MMRSMYSGVSGLKAHQVKMDVIGNNIANVNTAGFKAQRVTFTEVFSQTTQSATGASADTGRGGRNAMQIGLGVNVASVDSLMTTGSAQRTDNPFDVMVSGDGFLVVSDSSGQYFTKAGSLRIDTEGNLVIPNGMKVQGWQATEDGKGIVKGEVSDIKLGSASNMISNPQATTSVKVEGNLNTSDSPVTSQYKFYDSLGNYYTSNLTMTYDAEGTPPVWNVGPQTFDADGNVAEGTEGEFIKVVDANGDSQLIPVFEMFDYDALNTTIAFDTDGNIDLENSTGLNAQGQMVLSGTTLPGVNATIAGGEGSTLSIDFSSLTQVSSKTNLESSVVDGRATGEMQGYDISGDGIIVGYYDNGESKMLGQIVVAEFANSMGLERVGDNVFRTTMNSGEFDGIGNAGIFQAGVLEMSNVDLSTEFTEMITTQRGFQASSRIISTSDEMLQELVNIKR